MEGRGVAVILCFLKVPSRQHANILAACFDIFNKNVLFNNSLLESVAMEMKESDMGTQEEK